MPMEQRPTEAQIRRKVADELDGVAEVVEERIDFHESGTAYEDVGAILRSWARGLHTGADQQRQHAERLEAGQHGR